MVDPNTFASAVLSPDGTRLFAASTRGQGISFDLSPDDWKRHACLDTSSPCANGSTSCPDGPTEPFAEAASGRQ